MKPPILADPLFLLQGCSHFVEKDIPKRNINIIFCFGTESRRSQARRSLIGVMRKGRIAVAFSTISDIGVRPWVRRGSTAQAGTPFYDILHAPARQQRLVATLIGTVCVISSASSRSPASANFDININTLAGLRACRLHV